MNKYEIFNFISNEILPLEEKYDCHIFLYYLPHTESASISVHSNRWRRGDEYDLSVGISIGQDLQYCESVKQEIEGHIVKEKTKVRDYKNEEIQRLEKRLEELRG